MTVNTPLLIKYMTSQECNNNDVLCFCYKLKRQGYWCSCDCVSPPLILVVKSVVKIQASQAAILAWYEK